MIAASSSVAPGHRKCEHISIEPIKIEVLRQYLADFLSYLLQSEISDSVVVRLVYEAEIIQSKDDQCACFLACRRTPHQLFEVVVEAGPIEQACHLISAIRLHHRYDSAYDKVLLTCFVITQIYIDMNSLKPLCWYIDPAFKVNRFIAFGNR